MLFTLNERQSNTLAAKVFNLIRLAREQVFCRSVSDSTFLDIIILSFIKEKVSPAMKDIATLLRISPPAVTSIVDRLIERKYLKRIEDSTDRRVIRLSLTDKGEKEIAEGMEEAIKKMDTMLSTLDKEEQKVFEKLITKILNQHA